MISIILDESNDERRGSGTMQLRKTDGYPATATHQDPTATSMGYTQERFNKVQRNQCH